MRTINRQTMFVRLREMGIPTERIAETFKHVQENEAEWKLVKWELLKRCERGDRHVGGMGFVDEVRKELKAKGEDGFVLNNNWSPMYCRLFVATYPEYADRFEFRGLKRAA